MINYPYPRAFLRDTVTKDLLITDGVVTVNVDEYTITDDTVTITNPDLESESFELHQSLNSEDQLIFGSCESAYISFVFHPSTTISTLVGKALKVYVIPDHHPSRILQLGVFKVQEDKLTNNRKARKVVAYDAMYDILNTDMADWYNEIAFRQLIPGLEPVVSMSAFRNFFLQYFQIEIEETTLVNDNIVLHKTINPDQLSGADIIKAICEINGVFGQITNEGKFRFVELVKDIREESEEVTDLEVQHYIDVEYADYDSKAITGVRIITNEDIQGLGSREEPKNFYVINGNFLIADYKGSALVGVAKKILTKIINRYYQPLTVNALGNPLHEVGDAIKVILTDGTELPTYILERTLKGIQGLRDTYTAQGEETAAESLNSTSSRYTQLENNAIQAATEAATAATTTDFVEIIRNIGFRLLDEPTDVSAFYDPLYDVVKLSWTDPTNINTQEPATAAWAGTVVVRNDEKNPFHKWDGTVVVDSTDRNEYSVTPLEDNYNNFEVDKTYYYGIFPYDNAGCYRFTKVVGVKVTAMEIPDIASLSALENSITAVITIPEDYEWSEILLVYKRNSAPQSKTDGTAITITQAGSVGISNLSSNTPYYFKVFSTEQTSSRDFVSEAQHVTTGQGNVSRLNITTQESMQRAVASTGVVSANPNNFCHDTPVAFWGQSSSCSIRSCYMENDLYYYWIAAYDNSTTSFLTKIPGGVYNKLYIDMRSYEFRSNYNMSVLWFSTGGTITGYYGGNFDGAFKSYTLVNVRSTAEAINSQEGITINSTNCRQLDRQTVVVDISEITDDFFVGFHVCQNHTQIYNMWVDV